MNPRHNDGMPAIRKGAINLPEIAEFNGAGPKIGKTEEAVVENNRSHARLNNTSLRGSRQEM